MQLSHVVVVFRGGGGGGGFNTPVHGADLKTKKKKKKEKKILTLQNFEERIDIVLSRMAIHEYTSLFK